MTTLFKKYHNKVVEIEAVKITKENLFDLATQTGHKIDNITYALLVETLEGTMLGKIGNMLIRGLQGEYYPCRKEIFDQKYKEIC